MGAQKVGRKGTKLKRQGPGKLLRALGWPSQGCAVDIREEDVGKASQGQRPQMVLPRVDAFSFRAGATGRQWSFQDPEAQESALYSAHGIYLRSMCSQTLTEA